MNAYAFPHRHTFLPQFLRCSESALQPPIRSALFGTRGPKGAIGEMAIIWRRPRSAGCIALTDITALKIDYEDFWELMDERPALAQGVIKVLALRLDAAMENLQLLSQH